MDQRKRERVSRRLASSGAGRDVLSSPCHVRGINEPPLAVHHLILVTAVQRGPPHRRRRANSAAGHWVTAPGPVGEEMAGPCARPARGTDRVQAASPHAGRTVPSAADATRRPVAAAAGRPARDTISSEDGPRRGRFIKLRARRAGWHQQHRGGPAAAAAAQRCRRRHAP